jgi:hypothetical protein
MYCVKFSDRLRRKFVLFTEGNEENEGFRSGEATGEAVSFATVGVRCGGRPTVADSRLFAGSASLLQADLFQQRYEARLGANGIPHGIDFQFRQPGSALVNRPFEPVQRF